MIALFAILPLMNEQISDAYWVGYVAEKTEPAKLSGNNVASTFQVKYKGKQVTVTNLHVCRIPNVMEERRRANEKAAIAIINEIFEIFEEESPFKNKEYDELTDEDLIGKELEVGKFKREILAIDKKHDLCIVEGNPNRNAFSLASSYEIGELVRVIGYPRGLARHIREGRIVSKQGSYFSWLGYSTEYVLISAIAYPGNSGSPIINKYGNVVGVLFAGSRMYHTETMIVPLEYLTNFLERSIDLI